MTGLNKITKLQKTFTLSNTANFEIREDFGSKKMVSCMFQDDK